MTLSNLWQLHFLLDRKLGLCISRNDSPSHIYQIICSFSRRSVMSNYIENLQEAFKQFHITGNMLKMDFCEITGNTFINF